MKEYIKKIIKLQESGLITPQEMASMAIKRRKELHMRGILLAEVERSLSPLGFCLHEKNGRTEFRKGY